MTSTALFTTAFILLHVAHLLADYPFQSDHQAAHKAGAGRIGWRALTTHSLIHVAASIALLTVGEQLLDFRVGATAAVLAPLWLGVSHGFIDRRWPVARWMAFAGQSKWAEHGGAAHVDQTAHIALGVLPAALLIATLS